MRPEGHPEATNERMVRLLGLESSKIGFYADVKQKIRELEVMNLDLRTKKNELEAVFAAIRDGVVIFAGDRRVQFRNHLCPSALEFGTTLGSSCRRLFHPGSARDGECPVEAALRGESRELSFSWETDGRTRYFEGVASPIRDPFERPSRAILFLRDVTARKQQELQLLQAEKMSSIGVLAAGVAHEINNPLTSVAGYAEGLLRRFRQDETLAADPRLGDFAAYLQVIVREAYRCKGIIDSLLGFSRKSDGSLARVDLGALCREVLELVGHRTRHEGIDLDLELEPDLPPVLGDPAGLRQVILNLTLNALQALEGSGAVRISTARSGGRALLAVRDTGPGIPAEHLDQIWDPFFTTKDVGEGIGLGLALTYDIVRRHGGEIQVESRPGEGATFTVSLALAEGAPHG
ncbi:MAG: PAS domain-containing protein [Deltaproteobacteria bacterium]|nr:PAS domain-containing protein [Deltaproteobacteria bacterium]